MPNVCGRTLGPAAPHHSVRMRNRQAELLANSEQLRDFRLRVVERLLRLGIADQHSVHRRA